MRYTKQDVERKAMHVRAKYKRGSLTTQEVRFYESLPNWYWRLERRTPAQWVIFAKQLAKQNNGVLPCSSWLRSHGHSGLLAVMYKYPELFKDIEQENQAGRTPAEWVIVAKQLVREHNGLLPAALWLRTHGYGGLVSCMFHHPDLFKDIEQARTFKTPAQWIIIAKQLAKKHEGVLPHISWLVRNGYSGLVDYMRVHPSVFKGIKQEHRGGATRKTLAQWVAKAVHLAQKNHDVLPSPKQLRNMGLWGLVRCMKKHPNLFKDIKQKHILNTSAENVLLAKQLAKEHNGVLPATHWLRTHGYNGLDQCMRVHPTLFQGIKQAPHEGKTPEQWLVIAKQLAKQHNGVLPNVKWLERRGYKALVCCMYAHPATFRCIKQLRLTTQGKPM